MTEEVLSMLYKDAGQLAIDGLTAIVAWGLAKRRAGDLAVKVAEATQQAERVVAGREKARADAEDAKAEYQRAHEAFRKGAVSLQGDAKRAEAEWRRARLRSVELATSPEKAEKRVARLAGQLAALRSVELPDPDALPGLREWLDGGC